MPIQFEDIYTPVIKARCTGRGTVIPCLGIGSRGLGILGLGGLICFKYRISIEARYGEEPAVCNISYLCSVAEVV